MAEFFKPLRDLVNIVLKLDIDQIAYDIAKRGTFQELVISLNTEGKPTSQLYKLGEDATGAKLESIGGEYTELTKIIKHGKGQPIDRITLKDTGDFYMSFNIKPYKGGFIIDANPFKDQDNLFGRWGDNILGLNDENLQIVINYYTNEIIKLLQKKLNKQ